jgi:hypothetical protein
VWAKKIGGKLHDFGSWSDPDGALAKHLEQKDALHTGRTPTPAPDALAVKDVANAFLNAKREAMDAGELSPRTWADYRSIMNMMVDGLGKRRPVADLAPADFAAPRKNRARSSSRPTKSGGCRTPPARPCGR